MTVLIVFGAVATVVYAALAVPVILAALASGDGDPVADVERYLELTRAAHQAMPPGGAVSDPDGATSAAIGRFLAEKEEARRALWASRQAGRTERRTPCVSSSPERAAPSAAGSFPS